MARGLYPKPAYPIKDVKALVKAGKIRINSNAVESAWNDFSWGIDEIKKCILKLNNKYHTDDRGKNHYYKTDPHNRIPHTMMDFYKAREIMEGQSIYTHFYIDQRNGFLIISSFKNLYEVGS